MRDIVQVESAACCTTIRNQILCILYHTKPCQFPLLTSSSPLFSSNRHDAIARWLLNREVKLDDLSLHSCINLSAVPWKQYLSVYGKYINCITYNNASAENYNKDESNPLLMKWNELLGYCSNITETYICFKDNLEIPYSTLLPIRDHCQQIATLCLHGKTLFTKDGWVQFFLCARPCCNLFISQK